MNENERQIVYLDIDSIGANTRNPRKTFDEGSLAELSASIKEVGVLQPITVRSVGDGASAVQYEIVCGERRWRAAKQVGLTSIPAVVRVLSDEEAMDISITENLQRHDVSPSEEADAFAYLLNGGKSIADLCVRFGKSQSYIRGRLKLLDMYEGFRRLLEQDEISISQAMEVVKFDVQTQETIYNEHFASDDWRSWRKLSARAIYDSAVQSYTRKLSQYTFDKGECEACANCTKNSTLFDDMSEASCMDLECLGHKEQARKLDAAVELQRKHPEAHFVTWNDRSAMKPVLEGQKFEVSISREYISRVGAVVNKELRSRIDKNEVFLVIDIENEPYLGYIEPRGGSQSIPPIAALRAKDKRNKEIAEEKTIAEVREAVRSMDIVTLGSGDITPEEKTLVTFVLLHQLKPEQQSILCKPKSYCFSDEEVWEVVKNASPEQVRFIWRTAILNGIGDHIQRDLKTALFFDWVDSRDKQIVPTAVYKHNEIYLQRHEKIEARIAAIELNNEA